MVKRRNIRQAGGNPAIGRDASVGGAIPGVNPAVGRDTSGGGTIPCACRCDVHAR